MVGPIDNHSKQYEYVVISNWAKYPVIGLARNLEVFNSKYRKELVERFKNEGLIHDFSELAFDIVFDKVLRRRIFFFNHNIFAFARHKLY